jgi:hypothetical protein
MGSKGPADGPTFFCFRLNLALRHNYDIAPSQRHHSHARKIPKVSKRPPKQPELVLGPLPIDTINKTIGTELEPGDVVLSRAAQIHAARKHPLEYPHCLPHLAKVICDPLYIGDDHKNRGIELIGRIAAIDSFVLIAVTMAKDERGNYNVLTFYAVRKEKIENRRKRGFVKVAVKAKGPP